MQPNPELLSPPSPEQQRKEILHYIRLVIFAAVAAAPQLAYNTQIADDLTRFYRQFPGMNELQVLQSQVDLQLFLQHIAQLVGHYLLFRQQNDPEFLNPHQGLSLRERLGFLRHLFSPEVSL